jgi:hypothetical protein
MSSASANMIDQYWSPTAQEIVASDSSSQGSRLRRTTTGRTSPASVTVMITTP